MAQTIPRCVNHPDTETRVACSSCDAPICTRCMRESAVGQKCPACARQPRSALAVGKPQHYLKAGAAGLAIAVIGGLALAELIGRLRFGIILSFLLGLVVGRVVKWGAQHQTHRRFEIMAVVFGVIGGALAGIGVEGTLVALARPFTLLGVAAAGYGAYRGLHT